MKKPNFESRRTIYLKRILNQPEKVKRPRKPAVKWKDRNFTPEQLEYFRTKSREYYRTYREQILKKQKIKRAKRGVYRPVTEMKGAQYETNSLDNQKAISS